MTASRSSTLSSIIEATTRSAVASSSGIACASATWTSNSGSASRAASASVGEPSIPTTRCPRAVSSRATRPSPQPISTDSRPGAGTRPRSAGRLKRQKKWSVPGERAHAIHPAASASQASRRVAPPAPPPAGSAGTRRHPVGVEHAVDVAQAVDGLLEALRVGDLDDEAVLDHRRGDDAPRLDDVAARLGGRPREVLEQPVAVPGVDLELDLERLLVLALPVDAHEALRVLAQRGGVRAVVAVDRDAATERDVADDRVARHRPAALRQAQHDVVDALDADAVRVARARRLAALAPRRDQRLDRLLLGLRRLALLEALQDLADDDLRRDLRAAEGDVEVLGLAEAHLADDVGEQRRSGDLLRRQAGLRERLLQQAAAGVLGVLAALLLEPLLDLVARARGLHHGEPVARRAALALGRQDLDDVARLQRVVQRDDLAVDLRAHAAVAELGVDLVGEVERRRAGGERLHLTLRGEDEDLLVEEVDLQVLHELLGVLELLLPVEHRAQPLELALALGRRGPAARAGALLVDPVGGDAELGHVVHLARADLDLEGQPLGPDHRRVQRLVHVELRHRDEVLEPPGERLPQRVDDAHRAVGVLHRVDDDPHGREVVDLVELAALLGHLRVDRVEVLRAPEDLGVDAERLELAREVLARRRDVVLALLALLVDQALDLLVLARVQGGEGEVLELPLHRVDAQPVGDRRVDLEGLLRLLDLLLLAHRADRPHVVQAIGELDEDDPDVRGHRDHHLAVVLGLRLVAARERDAGELRDAVDERRDLVAEAAADLVERGARVLDRVVQQRRAQRLGVEAQAGADLRDADRVDDEVLARLAALVGVVLAGEQEGVLDPVAVDDDRRLVGVLLDDREEVAEQAALRLREVGAADRRVVIGVLDAVDRQALAPRPRSRRRAPRGGPRPGPGGPPRSARPRPPGPPPQGDPTGPPVRP